MKLLVQKPIKTLLGNLQAFLGVLLREKVALQEIVRNHL